GTPGSTTPFGTTTPAGAGGAGGVGSSFTERLQNIIKRASTPGSGGGGDFQIIGPNKIIADERTNSLLIFAGRQDMETITNTLATVSRVSVLSRPRVQTSHAVPANIFVGDTVPYITGTTFGDFAGVSSRSVYQEKSVGISLQVLPLINPDGLVVMDIQQDIDQLGTPVTIDGNPVPTTTKRSAAAKVAVKDRDTVILGG